MNKCKRNKYLFTLISQWQKKKPSTVRELNVAASAHIRYRDIGEPTPHSGGQLRTAHHYTRTFDRAPEMSARSIRRSTTTVIMLLLATPNNHTQLGCVISHICEQIEKSYGPNVSISSPTVAV